MALPIAVDQRLIASVNQSAAKVRLHDQQVATLKTKNAQQAKTIATLTAQINDLYKRIGDPGKTGTAGLVQAQSVTLAGLELPTPHQTTANDFISTGAGSLSATDRTILNNAIQALNRWQQNAQNAGIEATH